MPLCNKVKDHLMNCIRPRLGPKLQREHIHLLKSPCIAPTQRAENKKNNSESKSNASDSSDSDRSLSDSSDSDSSDSDSSDSNCSDSDYSDIIVLCLFRITLTLPQNRPTGPIRSSSRNVHAYMYIFIYGTSFVDRIASKSMSYISNLWRSIVAY